MSRITTWSGRVASALSQFQDAVFFLTASILFLVSQVMSAPCTFWFFSQLAGVGIAAWFFAAVVELSGGYASWELMRRLDENALPGQAKKRKLPTWLCWLTAGVSLILEGGAIWAYFYARAKPLALATRLGLLDVSLYAALAYILALVGVMIVGFHAQRVRLNVREEQDGAGKPENPKPEKSEQQIKELFAQEHAGQRHRISAHISYRVMARDGGRCFYCGEAVDGDTHIDHFYPRSLGGLDIDPMNLVVSCDKCNLSKNNNPPTPEQIVKFQVHLLECADIPTKEKVWALKHLQICSSQKDIATALGTSPSYVSASLKDEPDALSEPLLNLCERLSLVGRPPIEDKEE